VILSVLGLSAATVNLRPMSPEDLLGLAEVTEVLGVSRATAARYVDRADFPRPETLARGRVWRRRDVERWAKKNLPLRTGRPPKKS
jgi:predicted DNA-binding transcriptional regulator AlpA